MAMLKLNGVTIPTAKGGTSEFTEIGERNRAFDGTMLFDRRALKRSWKFTTTPLNDLKYAWLRNMIQGSGYNYSFDTDLYSANGLGGTGVITQFASTAADGAAVLDENGVTNTKFGTGCVAGEDAGAINILTNAAETNPSSTSNWVGASATLSLDTSNFFVGTQSLKVISSAVSLAGAQSSPGITGVLNTTYTFSFYVKGTGTYLAYLFDGANGSVGNVGTPVTGSATSWRRVSVTYTTLASGSTPSLVCRMCVGDSLAKTYYCGGVQLQASGFPTSYIAAGSSRTVTSLTYAQNPAGPAGLTVNWWQTKPNTVSGAAVAFGVYDASNTNLIVGFVPSGTPSTYNVAVNTPAAANTVGMSGLSYTAAWHMITMTFRVNPETGESAVTLYKDAVLGATFSIPLPSMSSFTKFLVGTDVVSDVSFFRIDDMQFLPYPVDATWVSGMFAAGTANGLTPQMIATGSFIPDSSVTVVGKIDDVKFEGYYDSSLATWRQNSRIVSFTLDEV